VDVNIVNVIFLKKNKMTDWEKFWNERLEKNSKSLEKQFKILNRKKKIENLKGKINDRLQD